MLKNAQGQEASPPQPPQDGDPETAIPALDYERCQTVFLTRTRSSDGSISSVGRRCDRAPTSVMVENKPRSSHGKIHSMTMCDQCAKGVLVSQGPDYALFTPLTRN